MNRKRVNKYSSRLRKSPKIEPHSYYKSDVHCNIKPIDALHVKVDGVTYETTIKTLQETIQDKEGVKNTIKGGLHNLTALLNEFGYNTSNIELNALIDDINNLNIIHPQKVYTGYEIKDGYVIGKGYDIICELGEEPDDFDKGYWKFDGIEWVLDSVRYQQIWGGV